MQPFEIVSIEDVVVVGKLQVALSELGLQFQDIIAGDYGPHRIYEAGIIHNEPFQPLTERFCKCLDMLNIAAPTFKPQFYSAVDYPDESSNIIRTYLTIYI